jgi:hypothetical protein
VRSDKILILDGHALIGWEAFHTTFATALGFFDGYGRNMDAWNDCMGSIDDPPPGLSEVRILPGEVLTIRIDNATILKKDGPDQWAALVECSGFVNWCRTEEGEPAILALAFYG